MPANIYVESLDKKIREHMAEVTRLEREKAWLEAALIEYPDIFVIRKRNGEPQYFSKSVMPIANQWESGFACSCCSDAGYDVKPYVIFRDRKIYGGTVEIARDGWNGKTFHPDWKKRLENQGVHAGIIESYEILMSDEKVSDSGDW